MLKINKQTITLTKGDDASLRLVPRYKDRTEYVLTEGDSAVFRIKFGHTLVELECTLNLETNKIVVNITPNDTKDFNPGIYRYEAELITSFGFHYTFIADQTFILGQEYEQRITSTSNGNSSAVGGNLPEIDGIVDGEPVVYGDIQPTNPMMDYDELNHLPKLNNITIKGSHDNAYYGIPTKTSDLENDSDFVSDDEYVHTDNNYDDTAKGAVDALGTASTYDVPESGNASTSQVVKGDDTRLTDSRNPNPHTHSKVDIVDFPTNLSAFQNDTGFVTNAVNNLMYYYLKSETYTKTEVEQLIAAIQQGRMEIVAALPTIGEPNVIYLVPKDPTQTSNAYDEYAYINNAWEKIGDTDIDLSGYVTDEELSAILQNYVTTTAFQQAIANYYTKTETDNLLANKVDKVAGKGLSTNDYDNTAKGIVDNVISNLANKVDKEQGKGLSTNDYDNTAKGIVDGVTSALADKVDKETDKGLSTNDYTTAEKTKLAGISEGANKVESSETNGNIQIDGVETKVYDDAEVKNAIEDIDDIITTDETTVEGNPINFTTLSAQKSKSTILSVEPIQDLHGYDKPWVGGAGKNLLDPDFRVNEYKNVRYYYSSQNGLSLKAGNYWVRVYSETTPGTINILNKSTSEIIKTSYTTKVSMFTLSENTDIYLDIYYTSIPSEELSGVIVMLGEGTSTTDYEPYENICPISGRSEIGILGCGKNLLKVTLSEIQTLNTNGTWTDNVFVHNNGITFTVNIGANGKLVSIKANGTVASGQISQLVLPLSMASGNYYFSGCPDGGRPSSTLLYDIYCWDNTTNARPKKWDGTTNSQGCEKSSDYQEIKIDSTHDIVMRLRVQNNATVNNIIFQPMVCSSIVTNPAQFEPYNKNTDLIISLGQTVYGGTLDVENGILTINKKYKSFDGTESWTSTSSVSGRYIYTTGDGIKDDTKPLYSTHYTVGQYNESNVVYRDASTMSLRIVYNTTYSTLTTWINYLTEQNTNNTPVSVVYVLATPITFQLTPNEISLLEGVNNISTTGDKITLTYRNGKVATLGDLTSAVDNLDSKIDESKILTDTATGDKYILVVTNGVLSVQQISN